MKDSPLYSINWRDISRSLVIAVATPIAVAIQRILDSGKMDFSPKALAMIGIGGAISYLIKNFLTPAAATKTVVQDDTGKITRTVVNTDTVKVEVNPADHTNV